MKSIYSIETLLKLASIARNAGVITLKYFQKGAYTNIKADGSPVTVADKEAQEYIDGELNKYWPDIPCIGEERTNNLLEKINNRYWLVDPLDGTREFIKDRDEYTVNIALVENNLPWMGVIYAPAKDLLYGGIVGQGAYLINEEKLIPLPNYDLTNRKPVLISSRNFNQGELFCDLINKIQESTDIEIFHMGSSLKFCLIAEGSASFYLRDGRTMFWDSAAGHAIVKASGGFVTEWRTDNELTYDPIPRTFENPPFMVYRPEWKEFLLKK